MLLYKSRHIVRIKPEKATPLDKRKSTLLNQTPDMAHVHTEPLRHISNRQQSRRGKVVLGFLHEATRPSTTRNPAADAAPATNPPGY
jgi:hypothetical protein